MNVEKPTLRPYQERCIRKAFEYLYDDKRTKPEVLVAPTAAGKSLIIAAIADGFDEPLLVLQPSAELLKQNHTKLLDYGFEADIYSASVGKKTLGKITFATLGSIKDLAEDLKLLGVRTVLIDEAHYGYPPEPGSMFMNFMNELKPRKVIGLTATPYLLRSSMSGSELKLLTRKRPKFFHDFLDIIQIQELTENNFWSRIDYKLYDFDESGLELNSTGSDFTEESIRRTLKAKGINNNIFLEIQDLQNQGVNSILVFMDTVENAEIMANHPKIKDATFIHGKMKKKDRDERVEGFKSGKYKVLINHSMLCLDEETEILTESGWVDSKSMTYEHKVANWDNGKIYYETPKNIVRRPLAEDEYMVSLNNRLGNIRVTNNHNMLSYNSFLSKWEKRPVEEFLGRKAGVQMPVCGEVDSKDIPTYTPEKKKKSVASPSRRIIVNSYHLRKKGMSSEDARTEAIRRINEVESIELTPPHLLSLNDCFFIGMWLGDGTFANGRYSICQSKRYPHIVDKIESCLDEMGVFYIKREKPPSNKTDYGYFIFEVAKGSGFGPQKKEGIHRLTPYLNKDGAELLKGLNKDQIWELLLGFWFADGDHYSGEKIPNRLRINNTNKSLLDLLQIICVTRGISAHVVVDTPCKGHYKTLYLLSVTKRTTVILGSGENKFIREPWSPENVWCVETSSGNIITRRKGRVVVMGNCTGFDYPDLRCIIMGRPTLSLALYYQIVGRGTRISKETGKESCMFIDFCGTARRFGRVEDLVLEDVPGFGMAITSKDIVLTNVPIQGLLRTKTSLKQEQDAKEITVMPFGMHKGKPLTQVPISYIEYMLNKKDFNWNSDFMRRTKTKLQGVLIEHKANKEALKLNF